MILIHVLIGDSKAEHFQHSGSSSSDVVDEVVHAMMRCSSKLFHVNYFPMNGGMQTQSLSTPGIAWVRWMELILRLLCRPLMRSKLK
jgi:hypothetical protein